MTEYERNARQCWEEEKMVICEKIAIYGYLTTSGYWKHRGNLQELKAAGTITKEEFEHWIVLIDKAWNYYFRDSTRWNEESPFFGRDGMPF